LRVSTPTRHQITVVAPQHDGATATWLIERLRDGGARLLVGDQKSRLSPRRYPESRKPKSEE
jgi:hypothetical protein